MSLKNKGFLLYEIIICLTILLLISSSYYQLSIICLLGRKIKINLSNETILNSKYNLVRKS